MGRVFRFALHKTAPIFFSYLFIGIAFGILMQEAGYGVVWSVLSAVFIYAGSMQLVMVPLLMQGAPLYTMAIMTLFINARHIFYGLGFVESFRRMGARCPYMIFSLTDETYSILCSCPYPDGVQKEDASFLIALLNHAYWVLGCALGSLLGAALHIPWSGIEFSSTAFFVAVCVEQWRGSGWHIPALTGLGCALVSLLLLGPDAFLLPALGASTILLALLRDRRLKGGTAQ